MGQLIDGKKIASDIRARVRQRIQSSGITPGLAAVLVGSDPASHLYVRLKAQACAEVGIRFEQHLFLDTVPMTAIIARIRTIAPRSDIHGILVQLPLPAPLDADAVIAEIPPEKDVDGFHPANVARLLRGDPRIIPPLGKTILALLDAVHRSLVHTTVALLANSETFCRPIEAMLTNRGAIVQRFAPFQAGAHRPEDIAAHAVIISALGCGGAITAAYVRPGATLIDVGIRSEGHGVVRGDFSDDARARSAWYTPVPGGVGPVTVAMLLENVTNAALQSREHE